MSNPVLREEAFNSKNLDNKFELEAVMTSSGALLKTCVLGVFLAVTFAYTWYLQYAGFADKAVLLASVGVIGGIISALIIIFGPKNKYLAVTTPVYAMFEGLFLGSISAIFNKTYPGIVSQAVLGTIFTVFGMYLLFSTRIIKVTDTLQRVIILSTFSVCGIYLVQWLLMMLHKSIPGIFSDTWVGIGFSVVVIVIAAFNLLLDFNFIEKFERQVPKYFEWYGAFSLMVTIVWLYLEILKLLAKISSRR